MRRESEHVEPRLRDLAAARRFGGVAMSRYFLSAHQVFWTFAVAKLGRAFMRA